MKVMLLKLKNFFRRWYKHLLALPVLFLLILAGELVYSSFHHPLSDTDFKNSLFSDYRVMGVTIPKDLNFCGELVPVSDFTVREGLEKELFQNTFNQPATMLLNKKAHRWFPLIESILKKNGVPDDFKYVAVIESGFDNSPATLNSGGFWGIMIPVGQSYGLEIDSAVDERFNIEKSTEAACKCFKDAFEKYHSWTLAAAAYDMGTGALDEQLAKQHSQNYYDLLLNEETARYVYRILAFKEIISRPEAYGYKLKEKDLYSPIPTNAVKVDSSITDLATFAIKHKSTYKVLKTMNPWLLQSSLPNPEHKKYIILFPKNGVKLYGMDEKDSIKISLPVLIDTATGKIKIDSPVR